MAEDFNDSSLKSPFAVNSNYDADEQDDKKGDKENRKKRGCCTITR